MTKVRNKNSFILNNELMKKFAIPKNHIKIYGKHACREAIKNKNRENILILTTNKYSEYWKKFVSTNSIYLKILIVNTNELNIITDHKVHQNVLLISKPLKKLSLKEFIKSNNMNENKLIILDQISDPQNIGSIIRSAFAFGFKAVCITKHNSPKESSTIIKASSGEIEKVKIIEIGNIQNAINFLKKENYYIYGLSNSGNNNIKNISREEKKIALIVGSEGKGLRELTKKNVHQIFYIPINKYCNSINVSSAAAIAMYELST